MRKVFVSENGNEEYDPAKHLMEIWNFLYWSGTDSEEALLIAGDGIYTEEMSGEHRFLLACAEKNGCVIPRRKMDGAGNCMGRNGVITGWKTEGFKVITPEDIRPLLLAALGATEKA